VDGKGLGRSKSGKVNSTATGRLVSSLYGKKRLYT
jgi:hypothetical protein